MRNKGEVMRLAKHIVNEFIAEFENNIPTKEAFDAFSEKWYDVLNECFDVGNYDMIQLADAVISELLLLQRYWEECAYAERTYSSNRSRQAYFNC
jgi:hypothetical protein